MNTVYIVIMTPRTDDPLTLNRLHAVLDYDPSTGVFRWKERLSPRGTVGAIAGCVRPRGYRAINIDGLPYLEHRLAWFYVHGVWAPQVDHRNGQKGDNWIDNLRAADSTTNLQNLQAARSNSQTGFLGVVRTVSPNGTVRFQARITHPGKRGQYLGSRKTPEEAYELYLAAKRRLHKGNTL